MSKSKSKSKIVETVVVLWALLWGSAGVCTGQFYTIQVGSAHNDGTGDTLVSAFGKVNSNFANIYLYPVTLRGSTNVFVHTNGAIAGYFLKTDGSNAFWAPITGGGGVPDPLTLSDALVVGPNAITLESDGSATFGNGGAFFRDDGSLYTPYAEFGNTVFQQNADFLGHRITSLGTPIVSDDAATKSYVDQARGGGNASQFLITGTNLNLITGFLATNGLFYGSGLGSAIAIAGGSSLTISNGNLTLRSNSVINLGTSNGDGVPSLRLGRNAYVSDYTGSETWNFKTAVGGGKDSDTVAKINDVTTASNAVLTLGTNGMFRLQNYRAYDFHNFRRKVSTNGTRNVVFLGDSMMDGRLAVALGDNFISVDGFRGCKNTGPGGNSYYLVASTNGGTTTTCDDYNYWMTCYYTVPSAGTLTISNSLGAVNANGSVYGNILEIDYIAESGAGTFKIQTNLNAAGWVDMATGISANNGGTAAGVALKYTNAVSANLMLRVVGSSGNVKVIGGSIVDQSNGGGVTIGSVARGGKALHQFMSVPQAITGPIFKAWEPDLLIMKWADNDFAIGNFITGTANFNAWVSTYLTNTDVLWIDCAEVNTGTDSQNADLALQNDVTYSNAVRQAQAFYSEAATYGSFSNGLKYGFFASGDPHPTSTGDVFSANLIFDWARWYKRSGSFAGRTVFTSTFEGSTNPVVQMIDGANGNRGAAMNYYGFLPPQSAPLQLQGNVDIGFDPHIFAPTTDPLAVNGQVQIYYKDASSHSLILQSGNVIAGASVAGTGNAGFGGGFVTNNGVIWYSTNGTPTLALPNGSLATVTDGRFYVRSNSVWVLK